MAKNLNKSRILNSWIIAAITLAFIIFSKPFFSPESAAHETLDTLGLLLVVICSFGRVYTSAFLGGYKNQKLINYGPFSVVRNPLYAFSLLGVLGLSMVTMQPAVMVVVPISFLILYHFLIKREETFLKTQFAAEYEDYTKRVPRLLPNFKLLHTPEVVEVKPQFIRNAAFDAMWWFIGFWILETLEQFL